MENLKKAMIIRNGNVVGAVGDKNFSTLHIGCITPYLGTKDKIPRGYLLADGASYKTTDYPELFDIIGYTYGGSDGTFNVPNLCDGRFLEGSDTSGEYVEAGLPNITGNVGYLKSVANTDLTKEWNGAFKWTTYTTSSNIPSQTNSANTYDLEFDASKSNAIYSNDVDTVQPKSLRVLYIIKAFHTNEGVDSNNEVSDPIIEYVDNKVASELKTSSNTDVVHVTLTDNSTFKPMGDTYCKYQVKNGICYFQFFVASSVATDTFTEIYNGLPKPIFSQYFSYPVYYNSQGLNKTLQVNISEGGLLTAANALPTTSYMIVGSYPIV